jgi:hypothetical protein
MLLFLNLLWLIYFINLSACPFLLDHYSGTARKGRERAANGYLTKSLNPIRKPSFKTAMGRQIPLS